MKPTFLIVLLVGITLSFSSRLGIAADALRYVAVASYRNTPEMNGTVGNRAYAILHAKKIESIGAGSFGVTISVPADRATEALQLSRRQSKRRRYNLLSSSPKEIVMM